MNRAGRTLVRGGAWLLAGALASYAVAFAALNRPPAPPLPPAATARGGKEAAPVWTLPLPPGEARLGAPRFLSVAAGRAVTLQRASWGVHGPPTTPAVTRSTAHGLAAGWPARSFCLVMATDLHWGEGDRTPLPVPVAEGGLVLASGTRGSPWLVPLTPVWAGLTADAALYGLALWCVFAGPGTLRRALRRRRGRCPACGYDRAGLPPGTACPECGGPGPGGALARA